MGIIIVPVINIVNTMFVWAKAITLVAVHIKARRVTVIIHMQMTEISGEEERQRNKAIIDGWSFL